MTENEDLYWILGVNPEASADEIKEAYIYKVNLLHPDRLSMLPPKVRTQAEADLKKVNRAYRVLSDSDSRCLYDARDSAAANRPMPEVHPETIVFNDCLPYVKQKRSFFITNRGGPFCKVLLSPTPKWLRVLETRSVQADQQLPMQVDIEAVGTHWDAAYIADITVCLDSSESNVHVELHMQKRPDPKQP